MSTNPYPGLRPFDEGDTEFFFGRDRQISDLIDRLRTQRFVGVVGFSGSGKSSLVLAGLVPALRAGQLGPSERWQIAILRPSQNPVGSLAGSLNRALGDSPAREEMLDASTFGLLQTNRDGRPKESNLLVVVDQLEDLFRLVEENKLDAQRAAHFISLLLTVAEEPRLEYAVYVVATMRSEYLGHCARFYGLPETLNRCQYLVPRLTPDQLREVIEAPAASAGVDMEPALVQRLLVDASTTADELPRLQHLLARLWDKRESSEAGDHIQLAHYRLPEIGGLEQALHLHAQEVYRGLSDKQKLVAQRVFQRLTMWSEASRDARRPTGRSELLAVTGATADEVNAVVEAFRRANFLTEIPASGEGEKLIDITHESLIRQWERLKTWAKKEARAAEIFRSLAGAAETKEKLLWTKAAVQEAVEWRDTQCPNEIWADRYRPGLLQGALGVLKQLEDDIQAAELLKQSEKELKADAKRKRRLIEGMIGVMLLMAVLSWWALKERAGAIASAKSALTLRLATEAVSLVPTGAGAHAVAALLATESVRRQAIPENLSALWRATAHLPPQGWSFDFGGAVRSVAFSPDGKWVVAASDDKNVRVMETATGKESVHFASAGVNAVAFTPDGERIATGNSEFMGGRGGSFRLFQAATGRQLPTKYEQRPISTIAFSPDGQRVVVGGLSLGSDTARVMDAGGQVLIGLNHPEAVNAVAFSPDSKWLATGGRDNKARIMEAMTGKVVATIDHGASVRAVAFSPDSKWLATGADDRTARITEALTGIAVARLAHGDSVRAVAFSRDGRWLATGSDDSTVRVMEAATGKEVARFSQLAAVNSVAFSPDGKWLASGGEDRSVRMLSLTDSRSTRVAHELDVTAMVFTANGKLLATASCDEISVRSVWRVIEADTGKEMSRRLESRTVTPSVALSLDAGLLAGGSQGEMAGGFAEVFELATQKRRRVDYPDLVTAVAFSPDGKWLATGIRQGGTRTFDVATGKQERIIDQGRTVTALAFSPNGRWLATADNNRTAQVIEAGSAKAVASVSLEGNIRAVGFSPDSRLLATASDDKTARLFEAANGKELARLAHQGAVRAVAFRSDGKQLLTGGDDKNVRLMDVVTGKELIRYQMENPIVALSFRSASLLELAVQDSKTDLSIHRISLNPEEVIHDACSRLPRNLTREEWEHYLPGEKYRKTCGNLPDPPQAKAK